MKRRTLLQALAAFFTVPLVPEVIAEDDYDDEARFEWIHRLPDNPKEPSVAFTYQELDRYMTIMLNRDPRTRLIP